MLAGMTMLAAAAAEAAHEAAKSGGLPQLDATKFAPQLFWLVLTFVALFIILSKVALPRVGEVITERRDRIQRDIDAAAKLKADTDKALADYEKALADARAKASGIAKETREMLAKDTEAQKAKVESQISVKLAEAEKRIGDTKSKALSAVNDIAADTAVAVVSKLIGHDVSIADVKKALAGAAGE
jgi:F-type H+-transporting ATPase subunit b